ncbi:MAG: hypothetical protein QNK37_34775 [Acidobacteriota bacterium]|nr:hypothetical protein [Acidobacteriota bacterium]
MRKLFWMFCSVLLLGAAGFITLVKLETLEAVEASHGRFHEGILTTTYKDGKTERFVFHDPVRLVAAYEALDDNREIALHGKRISGEALSGMSFNVNIHGSAEGVRLSPQWAESVTPCGCSQRDGLTYTARAGKGLRSLGNRLGI